MFDQKLLSLLAAYNRWQNANLYAVCATLPEVARKRDLGAFFRSIHGTLNHLLLVDRLWLGRLLGQPFAVRALDQELYADFVTLQQEREETDKLISVLAATLSAKSLAAPLTYVSLVKKTTVTLPLGLVWIHLFQHQTHHRGQITTLLTQLGCDLGETDLIYLPDVASYFSNDFPVE